MEESQRYAIPYKGLKNGCHEFRFEVDGSLFEEYQSTEIKDGRCEVTVAADRSESQVTLDVAIAGYVVVECDRCLEDCRVPIDFEVVDAQDIPYADASYDVITMAYGIRNMPDRPRALSEMFRVLKPGGSLVCLEFSTPPNATPPATESPLFRLQSSHPGIMVCQRFGSEDRKSVV